MWQHRLIQRWGWALLASLSLLPPVTLAFNPPQLQQAARLIDQLITAAQMGDAAQIEQIRQRIEALPKPPGKPSPSQRREARQYNDRGLERFRQEEYREARKGSSAIPGMSNSSPTLGMPV